MTQRDGLQISNKGRASCIDQRERAHNARCRAQTLRDVASELHDARAALILRTQADAWERQAADAEGLADADGAPPFRHKRLDQNH
jgi:hypothetical protein